MLTRPHGYDLGKGGPQTPIRREMSVPASLCELKASSRSLSKYLLSVCHYGHRSCLEETSKTAKNTDHPSAVKVAAKEELVAPGEPGSSEAFPRRW